MVGDSFQQLSKFHPMNSGNNNELAKNRPEKLFVSIRISFVVLLIGILSANLMGNGVNELALSTYMENLGLLSSLSLEQIRLAEFLCSPRALGWDDRILSCLQ